MTDIRDRFALPLRKVTSAKLKPGDLFESDGMEVVAVEPFGDTEVTVRYLYEGRESSYRSGAATVHLVRRARRPRDPSAN